MKNRPLPLKPGDRILVIAPASPPAKAPLQAGIQILEGLGYRVESRVFQPGSSSYLAGDDGHRAQALSLALADEGAACVWAARGGFGSTRILDQIGWPLRERPPLLLGFSDITVLLCEAFRLRQWVSLHAPSVTSLATLSPESLRACMDTLAGSPTLTHDCLTTLHPGQARGTLLPMNLTMLLALAGTPHFPDLAGTILVLEDVNEPPYRLDRLFTHLSMLPGFPHIAGLVLGDFGAPDSPLSDPTLRQNLLHLFRRHGIPAVEGIPMGHGSTHFPIPLGVTAHLDATGGTLHIDAVFP